MILLNRWKAGLQLPRLLLLAAVMALLSTAPNAEETPKPKKSAPAVKPEKKTTKTLTGAELYAINCNRCHPERYAPERTAEQWKTIMLHMRTRANLPAAQARAILQFLQEDSGK
jgi:hypothetical protein